MKKKRAILSLLLLVSCFVILAPELTAQENESPEEGIVQRPARQREKLLNLSEEQKARLRVMRQKWMEENKAFREDMRATRGEIRKLRQDPEANKEAIEKLRDEMFSMRLDRMKRSYLHQKEVRSVYTPEQLKKMNKARRFLETRRGFRGRGLERPGRSWSRGRMFRRAPILPWRARRPYRGRFFWHRWWR